MQQSKKCGASLWAGPDANPGLGTGGGDVTQAAIPLKTQRFAVATGELVWPSEVQATACWLSRLT